MANNKPFVVKNGLQSQNIRLVSDDNEQNISIDMLDSGDAAISGATGPILNLTDTDEGTVFSVIGTSNTPSIEIDRDGTVKVVNGSLLVGTDDDDGENAVQVVGSVKADTFIGDLKGSLLADDSTMLFDAVDGTINLNNNDTDDLPEGEENLYFTKNRTRKQSRIMALIFGSCS